MLLILPPVHATTFMLDILHAVVWEWIRLYYTLQWSCQFIQCLYTELFVLCFKLQEQDEIGIWGVLQWSRRKFKKSLPIQCIYSVSIHWTLVLCFKQQKRDEIGMGCTKLNCIPPYLTLNLSCYKLQQLLLGITSIQRLSSFLKGITNYSYKCDWFLSCHFPNSVWKLLYVTYQDTQSVVIININL